MKRCAPLSSVPAKTPPNIIKEFESVRRGTHPFAIFAKESRYIKNTGFVLWKSPCLNRFAECSSYCNFVRAGNVIASRGCRLSLRSRVILFMAKAAIASAMT